MEEKEYKKKKIQNQTQNSSSSIRQRSSSPLREEKQKEIPPVIKPKLAKLSTFHPEYAHMKIAKQLAAKLFPLGFHFFPDNPKKNPRIL